MKFINRILSNRIRIECGPRQLNRYSELLTGWTVRRSNPGAGARFYESVQTDLVAAQLSMGTGSFQWVNLPGHGFDYHLVPRLTF